MKFSFQGQLFNCYSTMLEESIQAKTISIKLVLCYWGNSEIGVIKQSRVFCFFLNTLAFTNLYFAVVGMKSQQYQTLSPGPPSRRAQPPGPAEGDKVFAEREKRPIIYLTIQMSIK